MTDIKLENRIMEKMIDFLSGECGIEKSMAIDFLLQYNYRVKNEELILKIIDLLSYGLLIKNDKIKKKSANALICLYNKCHDKDHDFAYHIGKIVLPMLDKKDISGTSRLQTIRALIYTHAFDTVFLQNHLIDMLDSEENAHLKQNVILLLTELRKMSK